jgi:hypothetical protein
VAAPEYSDFALRFHKLVADPVPDADDITWIEARLVEVFLRHPYKVWKALQTEATLLHVAHQWSRTLADKPGNRGGGGALTSKSVGGWSKSWASPAAGTTLQSWYASSEYGKEYLALRSQIAVGPVAARG